MSEKVTEALEQISAEAPKAIIAIGIKDDGTTVIRTSETNVAVMHWLMNKAIFELNVFEANQKNTAEEAA